MKQIKLDNVMFNYHNENVLTNLNLTIPLEDKIIGLLGPNGAGKTTLLRILSGQINSFRGVLDVPPGCTIAYLPDFPFLYPFLTISQIIKLGTSLFTDFDTTLAAELFHQLGLARDLKVCHCSKGMSEQIHLALILSRRSSLYVMDEPLASVDPLTRDNIIQMILDYKSPNSAVLISTHLVAGLESLFNDTMIMINGEVIAYDSVAEITGNHTLEDTFKRKVREYAMAH